MAEKRASRKTKSDRPAGQRNRLGRCPAAEAGATTGGGVPHRRGVGVAAGPMGLVRHGPAGNPSRVGASWRRLRVADGGTGSDNAGRSSHDGVTGRFCGVRKGDSAGTSPCRLGARQNGQRLGRPLTATLLAGRIRKLYRAGITKAEIARQLQIGRTSVRRILKAKKALG